MIIFVVVKGFYLLVGRGFGITIFGWSGGSDIL